MTLLSRRGPARYIGKDQLIRVRPYETVTKSLRDHNGIAHEVLYRHSLGDGRYKYELRCRYFIPPERRRWKETPVTCLECIAVEVPSL